MYNVKERFEKIQTNHPLYSTYTAFAETIRDTGMGEDAVRRNFHRLVDKDDYVASDRTAILRHLVTIAQRPNLKTPSGTTGNGGKNRSGELKIATPVV